MTDLELRNMRQRELAEAFINYCTGAALDSDGDLILPAQDDGTPHPLVQMALKLAGRT